MLELLSHIKDNKYTVTNLFPFAQEISNVANNYYFMARFDVISLFTNISVLDIINIILSQIFNSSTTNFNDSYSKTFRQF